MSNGNTDLATTERSIQKHQTAVGDRGIVVSSFDDLWRLACAVTKSGLAPQGLNTAEAVMIAIEMGMELGLPPLAALRGIAVINGRPSIYGDLAMAVVHRSGRLEWIEETVDGQGDARAAHCKVKRIGRPNTVVRSFSVNDAKRAKLWGKAGPWTNFPDRMMQMRARGYTLRDEFADVLQGLYLIEEAQDIPANGNGAHTTTVHAVEGEAPSTDPLDGFGESNGQQPAGVVATSEAQPATVPQTTPTVAAADHSPADEFVEHEMELPEEAPPAEYVPRDFDELLAAVISLCSDRGIPRERGEAACAKFKKMNAKPGKPIPAALVANAWAAAQDGRGYFADIAEKPVAVT